MSVILLFSNLGKYLHPLFYVQGVHLVVNNEMYYIKLKLKVCIINLVIVIDLVNTVGFVYVVCTLTDCFRSDQQCLVQKDRFLRHATSFTVVADESLISACLN